MEPLLEVKSLSKVFALGSFLSRVRIKAVDEVTFSIQSAEIFTLAGESGCGKTTTARMILGFETPTSGKILFRGEDVEGFRNRRKWFLQVQAVFQNPFETFNSLRRVESYFFETVHNFDLANTPSEARSLIDEKLKAVGLSLQEISGKYPSEFSGGQLQRTSIARALLANPSLLVADEPVSMVDASLRMAIVNLFRKLCDNFGVSVLYITHDLATAYYISDRIGIMFRGNLVEMGPTEKVLGDPKHPYTKLLLNSIPQPDPRMRYRTTIQLLEEREEYLLEGCKFANRCPEKGKLCSEKMPAETFVDGRMVRCHLYSSERNNLPEKQGAKRR